MNAGRFFSDLVVALGIFALLYVPALVVGAVIQSVTL